MIILEKVCAASHIKIFQAVILRFIDFVPTAALINIVVYRIRIAPEKRLEGSWHIAVSRQRTEVAHQLVSVQLIFIAGKV